MGGSRGGGGGGRFMGGSRGGGGAGGPDTPLELPDFKFLPC